MAIHRFEGRVLDQSTGGGDLSALQVEAWDSQRRLKTPVALVGSNKEGEFEVRFDDAGLEKLFGKTPPLLFFRVLGAGGGVLASTERTLRWDARSDGRGKIEVRVDRPIGTQATPVTYVVEGRLVDGDGNAAGTTLIQVLRRQLDAGVVDEEPLEAENTRTNGRFRIVYDPKSIQPDIVVRAVDSFGVTIAEKTVCRAGPVTRVDLVTTGGELEARVRYNVMLDKVTDFIDGLSLGDLTAEQIAHVACRLDEPEREVEALVHAAKLSSTTPNLPKEIYFGLIMQQLPKTAEEIFSHKLPMLRSALERAVAARQVPAEVGTSLSTYLTRLEDRAVGTGSGPAGVLFTAVAGRTPVGLLAETASDLSAPQHRQFARLVFQKDQTAEAFWDEVAADGTLGLGTVNALQFTTDVANIIRNVVPLLEVLQGRRISSTLTSARDLASYTQAQWESAITEAGDVFPTDLVGSTAEKRTTYALAIMAEVERRFRTAYFAARLGETESSTFTNFFRTHPEFDFATTRAGRYAAANPGVISGSDLVRLKKIERLFKVTSSYAETAAVADAGYTSATQIHAKGFAAFQESVSLDPVVAKQIFEAACSQATTATALAMKYSPKLSADSAHVLPSLHLLGTETLPEAVADWETLFGDLDQCACEQCQSVYGASAYLVDLLQFLRRQPAGTGVTALDKLTDRRPDIRRIKLTCDDAHVPLPYIDLVNEVLELKVVSLDPDAWPAMDVAVESTSSELHAHPEIKYQTEHVFAYKTVATAVHPLTIPFDVWVAEANVYLEHLGLRRYDIIEKFKGGSTAADWAAADALHLNLDQRSILLASPPSDPWRYWGFSAAGTYPANLASAQTFLQQSGITFDQLRELVASRWAEGKLALSGEDTCDLDSMSLTALSETDAWFLHRFLRLMFASGASITELDEAFTVLGSAGTITGPFLGSLGVAERVRARLGLSWLEALAFWGDLSRRDGWAPSLFRQVFLSKHLQQPEEDVLKAAMEVPPNGASSGSLRSLIGVLQASLEASAPELQLVLDAKTAWRELGLKSEMEDDVISRPNLSRLYRIVRFSRAIGAPVRDVLALGALAEIPGLAGDSSGTSTPAATLALADVVQDVAGWPLSVDEVLYVLRDTPAPSSLLRAADVTVAGWNRDLETDIARAYATGEATADPSGDVTSSLLRSLVGQTVADRIDAILKGGLAPDETVTSQQLYIDTHLEPFVEDVTDAHNNLVIDDSLCILKELDERYTYLAKRLVRYTSARSAALNLLIKIGGLPEETTAVLAESGILTTPAPADAPMIRALVPAATPASPAASATQRAILFQRFAKAALIVRKLALTPREVASLYPAGGSDPGGLPFLDLDLLPTEPEDLANVDADLHTAQELFASLRRLVHLVQLRASWRAGSQGLFGSSAPGLLSQPTAGLFALAAAATSETLATILDKLSEQSGWNRQDLAELATVYGLTKASFTNELAVLQLRDAIALLQRTGASAAQAVFWTDLAAPRITTGADLDDPPSNSSLAIARDIKRVARSRHGDEEWGTIAAPIRNKLREQQRTALVSFLTSHGSFADTNELYANLLVDVEMGPLQDTSRIVQANGSIQQFIFRALLGHEDFSLDEDAAREWQWMRNYRVWEANRKVFLYPENWIEPELRDDKTALFSALERQLKQGELTATAAESAYKTYLDGLYDLSTLEIVALYAEETEPNEFSVFGAPDKVIHVFGRSAKPRRHYYRSRRDGAWSPWTRVDLDIESEHLMPIAMNGRLHLFWFLTEEVARGDNDVAATPPAPSKNELLVGVAYSVLGSDQTWSRPTVIDRDLWIRIGAVPDVWWNIFGSIQPLEESVVIVLYGTDATVSNPNPAPYPWTKQLGVFAIRPGDPVAFSDRHAWVELLPYPKPWSNSGQITESQAVSNYGLLYDNQRSYGPVQMVFSQLSNVMYDDFNLVCQRGPEPSDYTDRAKRDWYLASDTQRTFFVERVKVVDGYTTLIVPTLYGPVNTSIPQYSDRGRIEAFSHGFVRDFSKALAQNGIDGLLRWADQGPTKLQLASHDLEGDYLTAFAQGVPPFPLEEVDFRSGSATAIYNWELFFHVPFYIAVRLMREQRFQDAQKWFHYIFDPTDGSTEEAPQRFWKVRPFYENKNLGTILEELTALSTNAYIQEIWSLSTHQSAQQGSENFSSQIDTWRREPFSPHAIARMRPLAYQKAVVMRYIENLLAWGDQLFAQDSIESINEATQLYALAQELLGDRPRILSDSSSASLTYNGLPAIDAFSNSLAEEPEAIAPPRPRPGAACGKTPGIPYLVWGDTYFCVPANDRLLGLWDVVADRLFKIRHSMNLEGVFRTLPLFQPPIDPAILVRAFAAGVDIASVLNDMAAAPAPYRYATLFARAMEAAQATQSLGASLLAALEKRDAESFASLRAGHETAVTDAIRDTRRTQVKEAETALESLRQSRQVVEERRKFYASAPAISETEETGLQASRKALLLSTNAEGTRMMASMSAYIPDAHTGAAGMSSPVASFSFGGSSIARALDISASATSISASQESHKAATAATLGDYQRRFQEYQLQARLAGQELKQIDKEIAAAELRVAIATMELRLVQTQLTQSKEVESFLRSKYTNEELYDWMVGETSAVYFQSYKLAFELAKTAQKAFQIERGDPSQTFVSFGYWDGLKKGLLAAEKLALDLRRMDAAYIAQNKRELELTKLISLAEHDPERLVELRETGIANFGIAESDYDRDFKDHYLRRLKAVTVSLPCTVGPYQGVHGTLELLNGGTRQSPTLTSNQFTISRGAIQSICTSQAQSDSGVFELVFRDERFLPFEAVGAHGVPTLASSPQWRFTLGNANRFDFASIDDLVLEVRYTARRGRTANLPSGQLTLHRLVRVKEEFPDAWQAFIDGESNVLPFGLPRETWTLGRDEELTTVDRLVVYGKWQGITSPTMRLWLPGDTPTGDGFSFVVDRAGAPVETGNVDSMRSWVGTSVGYNLATAPNFTWNVEPSDRASLNDVWVVLDYKINVAP